MKKKLLAVSGLLLFVLVLSGCGKAEQKQNQELTQEANQVQQSETGSGNQEKKQGDAKGNGPGGASGVQSEEAKTACTDKSEGDNCSFSMTPPNEDEAREISGTCEKNPQSDALACRPGRPENAESE
jgi:hypothetical protein